MNNVNFYSTPILTWYVSDTRHVLITLRSALVFMFHFVFHLWGLEPCSSLWPAKPDYMTTLGDNSCHGNTVWVKAQTSSKACSHTRIVHQERLCPAAERWEIHVLLIPLTANRPRMTVKMVCHKKWSECNFDCKACGYYTWCALVNLFLYDCFRQN